MFLAGQRLLQFKGWIGINARNSGFSPNWSNTLFIRLDVESLTHSQQQPQGPSTHKYKPTITSTAESQCSVPSKGSWYTSSWSWMKSHTRKHSQQQLRCFCKRMSTVNITENYAQHTFQAPRSCCRVNLHRNLLIEISEHCEYCLMKIKYLVLKEKNIFNWKYTICVFNLFVFIIVSRESELLFLD